MRPSTHIYEIWRVAAVLLGFQMTVFIWRLNREVALMSSKPDETNWFPPADYLNLSSMFVLIFAVFLAPALDGSGDDRASTGLRLALCLLAGYPFAIAGHYRLFRIGKPARRPYCTFQEGVAVLSTMAFAGGFMVSTQFFGPSCALNWLLPLIFDLGVIGIIALTFFRRKRSADLRRLIDELKLILNAE
jgi:hypothetical protein